MAYYSFASLSRDVLTHFLLGNWSANLSGRLVVY